MKSHSLREHVRSAFVRFDALFQRDKEEPGALRRTCIAIV
jgi:hypothetical protein